MNFFGRAIKNIIRKPSKSILLILTFFLIGNLVIIGLSVANASESAKTLTRKKMRAVVSYKVDFDKFYKDAEAIEDEDERNEFYQKYPKITYKEVSEVVSDDRVKTANISSNSMFYPIEDGIDFVHLNNEIEESLEESNEQCTFDDLGNQVCEKVAFPYFFAKANFYPGMIELEEGSYKIVDGEFYSLDDIKKGNNVCLITEALANANDLRVGDTFSLASSNLSSYIKDAGVTEEDILFELQVIGIYSHSNPITPNSSNFNYCYPYENPDNMILLPGTTLNNILVPVNQKTFDHAAELYPDEEIYQDPANRPDYQELDKVQVSDATILLNDPLDVDDFVEDHKAYLEKYKTIDANNEEFLKLSRPLDTLSDYAEFIIWLVVINAIVIITLVTALTLKTREYEIGVLLSIGASKFKVILQFFIELALVALVGFTLSVGSGSVISKKIGYTLLENQIQSSGVVTEDEGFISYDVYSPWDNNYTSEITMDDLIAEYDVSVSPDIIAEIYVVGLGIVLISVIIPSIMIMRYNPKKILMNQG